MTIYNPGKQRVSLQELAKLGELLLNPTIINPTIKAGKSQIFPSGDFKIGNYDGGQGLFWDQSAGTLSVLGGIIVDEIEIGTSPNWFKVDSNGNAFGGGATLATAIWKILNTGLATFTNVTIEGGTFVATDVLLSEQRFNTLFQRYCFIGHWKDTLTETPGAGGSISRYPLLSRLTSTGADCTLNSLRMHVDSGGSNRFTTVSSSVEFIAYVQLGAIVSQDVIIGIADDGNKTLPVNTALTTIHMAFIVEDGTLYASTGNGSSQILSSAISGITLTDMNVYRISYDKDTDQASFYINDSLVATLASTGSTVFDPSILFGIDAIAGTKTMDITNNYLIIHS